MKSVANSAVLRQKEGTKEQSHPSQLSKKHSFVFNWDSNQPNSTLSKLPVLQGTPILTSGSSSRTLYQPCLEIIYSPGRNYGIMADSKAHRAENGPNS